MLNMEVVAPGYFTTVGVPVLRGRTFTEQDREDAPPVVVVSHSAAEHYWPGDDPLGKRLLMGADGDRVFAVVGVVPDTRYRDLREARPSIYFPLEPVILPLRANITRDPNGALLLADIRHPPGHRRDRPRRGPGQRRVIRDVPPGTAGAAQNERSSSGGVRGCCVDHSDCRSVRRHGGDGPPAHTRTRHSARLGGRTMGSAADGHAPRAHSRSGWSARGVYSGHSLRTVSWFHCSTTWLRRTE